MIPGDWRFLWCHLEVSSLKATLFLGRLLWNMTQRIREALEKRVANEYSVKHDNMEKKWLGNFFEGALRNSQ